MIGKLRSIFRRRDASVPPERLRRLIVHAKAVPLPGTNRSGIAMGPDGPLPPADALAMFRLSQRALEDSK